MRTFPLLSLVLVLGVSALPAEAQVNTPPSSPAPTMVKPVMASTTKLEGFRPYPGSVLTFGHEELGRVLGGKVVVELLVVKDSNGNSASGAVMVLAGGKDGFERAYVDLDELPALLKGLDVVLNVDTNPTTLKKFDVRFTTRDTLSFVAFSDGAGVIEYAVQSNKSLQLSLRGLDATEMLKLRGWFELALKRLSEGVV